MNKKPTRRISPKEHAKDLEIYSALKSLDKYAPSNPDYTQAKMDTRHANVLAGRDALAAAEGAVLAARDHYVDAQWEFHDGILGVKDQATAQFGSDSDEVQSLQLKKKSDYKKPTRKAKSKT